MTTNETLAQALQALATAIQRLQPQPAAVTHPVILDPFSSNNAFDLGTRSGSAAYEKISSPLDVLWDGAVETFPSFVVALRIRARKGKWDAPGNTGILTVDAKNVLTDYHSVTDAQITAAGVSRTNDRAVQNCRAMYTCIEQSITGDIKDTIFSQFDNIPDEGDGITLFKKLTTFTSVASLQLSILSFNNITNFNPFDWNFSIPIINSKLLHLFILATTSTRTLLDAERIQHTLNVYSKILQPESWAQWVRTKCDEFEENKITNCQSFMNTATVKFNKIIGKAGKFQGSVTTVQEDIVAMFAKRSNKRAYDKVDPETNDNGNPPVERPPFLTHFQDSNKVKYKVGDSKEFNGKTFYFCDCPLHRNRLKWHTHTVDKCRTRIRWLKTKNGSDNDNTAHQRERDNANTANLGETDDLPVESIVDAESSPSLPTQDVQALLASALNICGDNDILRDQIATAINTTADL